MMLQPFNTGNKPRSILRSKALWIAIALIALLAAVAVTATGDNSALGKAGAALTPVAGFFSKASQGVRAFFDPNSKDELEEENALLNARVAELENAQTEMEETQKENERLTRLLETKQLHKSVGTVHARVIGKSDGNWFRTFILNVGSADGIKTNMPVITDQGLVGRIVEVQDQWSRVLSLVDSQSAVSALIERTRDVGMMHGNLILGSEEDTCRMYYLQDETELVPGDVVLTSGLGGIYPKGIRIGAVTMVSRDSTVLEQYCVVKPSVDFLHLEDVLVMLYESAVLPEDIN